MTKHIEIDADQYPLQRDELDELRRRVKELEADARRYRWLRSQHWDASDLCVVTSPKTSVRLGVDCPSFLRLDAMIDCKINQEAKS